MATVCPSITASTNEQYKEQMDNIATIAHRIHIDIADGDFASPKTIDPEKAWWPVGVKADFHLMYKNPQPIIDKILEHHPNLIIIHAEADGNFEGLQSECRRRGVKVGVALLPETQVSDIVDSIHHIDHVLIFSGHLGHYGGHADLAMLSKVKQLKQLRGDLEIGWDGGIDSMNTAQLVFGGVDVLSVGGYIQESDNPKNAFNILTRIAEETGAT